MEHLFLLAPEHRNITCARQDGDRMQLVEQHRIDRHDSRFAALDAATFASKNLYNAANYRMRQAYIHENHRVMAYSALDQLMQATLEYRALPAKVAQWALKQVDAAWKSYCAAVAEWSVHPAKFTGHPKLPKYLDKQGRNLLVYTDQAISRDPKNAGWVVPSGVPIHVATKHTHAEIAQVRIVPKSTHYVVEVVYEREPDSTPTSPPLDPTLIASIDIGVNVLAAITSSQPGFTPLLVNGRPLKRCNQWYNKRRAKLQAQLPANHFTSRAIEAITDKRNRVISYYLHSASRAIINLLIQRGVGSLVIGKNDLWKQGANLGKRNNQAFVMLPHARFIEMLTYKALLAGFQVATIEESYTSKCSFLDQEPIQHHARYLGKRVKRGLFMASNGQPIHADINGSFNILRQYAPKVMATGVSAFAIHPAPLRLPDRRQDRSKQRPRRKATA
jgi:putative transposase